MQHFGEDHDTFKKEQNRNVDEQGVECEEELENWSLCLTSLIQ